MNVSLFLQTLPYALKGMLGIFFVTGVLILCIMLLNRLTRKPDEPSHQPDKE